MRNRTFLKRGLLLLACWFCAGNVAVAQPCTGTINTFPFFEGFEANNGNWVSGGLASDWAWGTPAKSIITGAAKAQNVGSRGG